MEHRAGRRRRAGWSCIPIVGGKDRLGALRGRRRPPHVERRTRARTWAADDGADFVEHRGFTPTRQERISAVDPRSVDTARLRDLPEGVGIVPLAALLERLPEVHAVYAEASADMPADHAESNLPLDEWLEDDRRPEPRPRYERGRAGRRSARGVVVDLRRRAPRPRRPRPHRHGATFPAPRPRAAGEAGGDRTGRGTRVTTLTTENDSENAAMLAINDELGFLPFAVVTEWVKPLT